MHSLRKNYKLKVESAEALQGHDNGGISRKEGLPHFLRLSLFQNKYKELGAHLNEFLLHHYLLLNVFAFHKNLNLLMDKVFSKSLKSWSTLRDFLLLELMFSMGQDAHLLSNSLLPFNILATLINSWDFALFFEDCWLTFKVHLFSRLPTLSLAQLFSLVEGLTFLNFQTHKSFHFGTSDVQALLPDHLNTLSSHTPNRLLLSLQRLISLFYNEER